MTMGARTLSFVILSRFRAAALHQRFALERAYEQAKRAAAKVEYAAVRELN